MMVLNKGKIESAGLSWLTDWIVIGKDESRDFVFTQRFNASWLRLIYTKTGWPVAYICGKIWGQGQSGQAIKLFWVPRKISFTFYFWHKSFILDDVKLADVVQQQFWMKECDILGGQNILWPLLHIFRGQDPFNPMIYTLWLINLSGYHNPVIN